MIDSNGLIVEGMCSYTSGGEVGGGGMLVCEFSTECKDGYKKVGNYYGGTAGFTAGYPVGSIFLPVSFDTDSLTDLEGNFETVSATLALGPGLSYGHLCLNNNCVSGFTPVIGIDASIDVFLSGKGGFSEIWEEKCCEKEDTSGHMTPDTF